MRNICAILLILTTNLDSMDYRDEQSSRGRTQERISRIDPEFAELIQNNQPILPDIEIEQDNQYWAKKLKKTKTGCLPNLHLRRLASIFIHTHFMK